MWSVLKPDDAVSVSERRQLASFPKISKEAVLSGSFMADFEKYAPDQFPLRETFRTVKAITTLYVFGQKDNNDVYIRDGFASALDYPLHPDSVDYAVSRFRFIYDRYLADQNANVYVSVIPDKNYYMAEENGYPSMDYEKLFSGVKNQMDFAEYLDITQLLELSDYYRTDSHWRQEKLPDVARYLAAGMGVSLTGEYTVRHVDTPFYGVYYGQSALPLPHDELYYLENETLQNCKVYDYETNAEIPVYDPEKLKGSDPYELFLSGSKSLLTIENPGADTDRELILFRDSFGSSIAPLLAEGYAKITLADIRYISPAALSRFIDFKGQDVLFLYSTSILNNSITLK